MAEIVEETLDDPAGPYARAVARPDRFLASWLTSSELPDDPPLA